MDPPGPTKKFQTRAGIQRKSKTEREQYAREEAERQQQRIAEAARIQSLTAEPKERSRPSGRGRGGAVVISVERIRSEGTGGVFGAAIPAPIGRRGSRRASAASRASLGRGEPGTVKSPTGVIEGQEGKTAEPDTITDFEKKSSSKTKILASKNDEPIYVSSDDAADEGLRRDIETIWISSDEEDEGEEDSSTSKGKQRSRPPARKGLGLRPVRAPRRPGDGDFDGSDQRTKKSGGIAGNGMARQPSGHQGEAANFDGDEMDVDEQFLDEIPSSPEVKKNGKRKLSRQKESKLVTESIEERAERLRSSEDVRKLRHELAGFPVKTSTTSDPMQEAMDLETEAIGPQNRRLVLFQFPPLTPFLVNANERIEIKEEKDGEDTNLQATSPVKGKEYASDVKQEADGIESKPHVDTDVADDWAVKGLRLPSGRVGKLNVHKSGKVTLDWGGTDMEVRYGSEVDFLQDAVLVSGESAHTTWALGQVQKKMVVIPDWQKLYD